jgi:hypothetical protein
MVMMISLEKEDIAANFNDKYAYRPTCYLYVYNRYCSQNDLNLQKMPILLLYILITIEESNAQGSFIGFGFLVS